MAAQFVYKGVTQRGVESTTNTLSTRFGSKAIKVRKSVTRVFNVSGAEIAQLQWGTQAPETLKFPTQDPLLYTDWMKKGSLPVKE